MSLLRYFEGAAPKRKLKATPSDSGEKKKSDETKRKRSFQPSWTVNRPWLVYNSTEGLLSCTLCKKHFPHDENAFVKGTSYMRIDGIKAHEKSECHVRSSGKENATCQPVLQTKAGKALVALKKSDHDNLIIKMRNAHACAKHSLSFRTYEVMCRLDNIKGLKIGEQYCSDKAGANFCDSIAKATRSKTVNIIEKSAWCSIMCDGSTDFTGEDMEAVYVRSCSLGQIKDSFLHLGSSQSSTSEDIYKFLIETFEKLNIDGELQRKLVGFCADGASNMQGANKGVAALLKNKWPHLITTHCLAHRLELAFKDAIKATSPKLYEKTTTLLLGIYYLFRKSPKQKKGLQRAFEAMGVKQLLPTRIGGTRWLPHYMRAIDIVLKTYKVLRYQLENSSHGNAKAEGLARLLRDGHVLVYILSLRRIIGNLQNLSLYLQKDGVSLADAYIRVESTKSTLSRLPCKEDSSVTAILETDSFREEKVVFRGAMTDNKSLMQNIVKELISSLDSRFPGSDFISATLISSFKNWPHLSKDQLTDTTYGEKQVEVLFNHFGSFVLPGVAVQDLTDQWSTLRTLVYMKYPEMSRLQWDHVMGDLSDQGLAQIFTLIEVVLALPPTSIKCETAFSAMKLLKTKRRGRLGNTRLNDLMTIKIMSPSIEEFDPESSLADWMTCTPSGQKRRIGERKKKAPVISGSVINVVPSDTDTDDEEYNRTPVIPSSSKCTDPEDSDSESEDQDEPEMTEDLVFSLLQSYYYDRE